MPIDAFFCSLAADQKSNAFGVILSGTASDGTLGLKAIKEEGGITFAQDERIRQVSQHAAQRHRHGRGGFRPASG